MHMLEIILLLWLVGMPIYTAMTFDKHKKQLIDGSLTRTRAYMDTIFFLWLPTLLLIGIFWWTDRELATIGLTFSASSREFVSMRLGRGC